MGSDDRSTGREYYNMYDEPAPRSSDHDIKSAVIHRLHGNPHTADESFRVEVHNGVVTLAGEVATALPKRAAGDEAWDTPGVVDVNNHILVELSVSGD